MLKMLEQHEAQLIASALATLNAIGNPFFQTVIHRPASKHPALNRREPQSIVFTWDEHGDPNVNEVFIHTTEKVGAHFRTSFSTGDAVESYADQNAFMRAYGIE